MKKIDEVYEYIRKQTSLERIKSQLSSNELIGVETFEIEKGLNIVRNNASTLLNSLFKDGRLIKVATRPVRFVPTEVIKELNNSSVINIDKNEYTIVEFSNMLINKDKIKTEKDPFTLLIGYDNSLLNQIEQAKAALMYPPSGLHTLLLGESGVGKTTFANIMYEYVRRARAKDKKELPFISFNCSDYYNNPQLLLSQLFGHIKGAFTGADSEKIGLVEKANGGILFLDEVHRLPPDGQEMLFFLMDKNEFHRLGETDKIRSSNVLIIAATTEKPKDVLLTTFLRRIPVIINLPSLREKSVSERIDIIEKLFFEEAARLKLTIKIAPEVLRALAIYDYKGNIGQLGSDIKLLCAKAFLQHMQQKEGIIVNFFMLPKDIKEFSFDITKLDNNRQDYLSRLNQELVIYPNDCKKVVKEAINQDIYDILSEKISVLRKKGLEQNEIENVINELIESFFSKVINNFDDNINIRQLYNLVDKKIVDVCLKFISFASEKLEVKFNNKLVFGLSFHVNSLLQRLKEGKDIVNPNLCKIKKQYDKEYLVVKGFIEDLSNSYKLNIPEDEVGFVTLLIANNKLEKSAKDNIGIIVVCHGDATASSMAAVCNNLLNENYVKAVDMSLDSKIQDAYSKVLSTALAIEKGKGILLLVDMGSLVNFGEKIMEQTGIKVKTISNVSTLTVLEALRMTLYDNQNLDSIYMKLSGNNKQTSSKTKKKAILSVCATGQGTSNMAKTMIENILKRCEDINIEVVVIDYISMEKGKDNYQKILNEFEFIACVGNIKPELNVPFFFINELLHEDTKEKIIKLAQVESMSSLKNQPEKKVKNIFELSRELLEQYVLYLNPGIAVNYIRMFIEDLGIVYNEYEDNHYVDLIVHIGCMLDRIISGKTVPFEGKENFKYKNLEEFLKIKSSIDKLGSHYRLSISDDEICYIIKVLHKN